jgi:hypothetical protein
MSLDTHEVVKESTAAGFTDAQAEAVTRVVRKSQEIDLSGLVTKTDLQIGLAATRTEFRESIAETKATLQAGIAETKADLHRSIADTKADLHKSIAETRADVLKWIVGSIGLQTIVILGAVITLVRMTGR